jgi:hypothetical protein
MAKKATPKRTVTSGPRLKLRHFAYHEFKSTPRYWSFFDALDLEDANLIVGMNASGKTRALNVIGSLAKLLSGKIKALSSGSFEATLSAGSRSKPYFYSIHSEESKITHEELAIGDELYLTRRAKGEGQLYANRLGDWVDFRVPESQLAAVAKRDALQHPYLERLHGWAESVHHFRCCTLLGKQQLVVVGKGATLKNWVEPHPEKPAATFLSGCNRYGRRRFKKPILQDMEALGYPISDITVGPPPGLKLSIPVGEAVQLVVQEHELPCPTSQNEMSEGMFRALALLIQVNFLIMTDPNACFLLDDIGEGLDYERSAALVRVIRGKLEKSKIQMVMASNNRLVMNSLPLREIHILERNGQIVRFFNYRNARDAFEEFEKTGLANFDFLRTRYYAEVEDGNQKDRGLRRRTN